MTIRIDSNIYVLEHVVLVFNMSFDGVTVDDYYRYMDSFDSD